MDSVTSKPALERTFGHFARVLVDIDLTQDLKFEVLVERKGYAFFVEFEYENLPDFCDYCKTVGHSVAVCRKRKVEADKQEYAHMNHKNDAAKEKVADQQQAYAKQQKKHWAQKEREVVDLDIDEGISNDEANRFSPLVNEAAASEQGDINNVELHSVIRNDRVNNPLINKVAASVQNSQDINNLELHSDVNRGSMGRNKDQNEHVSSQHVEDTDSDDHSSQASEFVDATQRLEIDSIDNNFPTPDRVQKDMRFLNDSCANLAYVDEEHVRLQQEAFNQSMAAEADIDQQINNEVQANIDSSGFHLVTRKSPKKKTQKASSPKASRSHLTRCKVPSKHFK